MTLNRESDRCHNSVGTLQHAAISNMLASDPAAFWQELYTRTQASMWRQNSSCPMANGGMPLVCGFGPVSKCFAVQHVASLTDQPSRSATN
jgi:hypothetical protein